MEMEFFDNGKLAKCKACNKHFLYYTETKPKYCPKCFDEIQQRPSVVVSRKCVWKQEGVKILSFPKGKWEDFNSGFKGDYGCYKIIIKGNGYGASWSGRIDIFADNKYKEGDIIDIREMEVQHKTKVKSMLKNTIYGMTVVKYEHIPLNSIEEGEIVVNTRRYLYFSKSNKQESGKYLIWDEARTKTTLSGLGRQYYAEIQDDSLKSWTVRGGYRSGRAYTVGILAVVDKRHPVIIRGVGDIEYTKIYPVG